ncbi:calcium-activated potassium channel slowpoke-like [Paramacrobiotus metropolitanus]|uniref:calcium-activated potassium channel slowpoke-like n=1 Tax=Paramacrobiotus metropolitanus TaxID=2943436 RepID=UPI002445D7E3|nr:calcium-activated potassium channel slowpoke-like [Paramacrobiotus metropolitanus]
MHDYLQGCHMELHSGPFTAACHGMTFFQAAEFCYSKLNVVLIGTFSPARTAQNGTQNGPLLCNANVRIEGGCIGIFLARSAIHARRVHWYCQSCHEKLPDITQLAPCNCENGVRVKQLDQVSYRHLWDHSHQDVNNAVPKYSKTRRQPLGWEDALMHKIRSDATVEENYSQPSSSPPTNPRHAKFMRKESVHANTQICLDVSRNFYWCESRPFASVLLDRRMALDYPLSGHIVVLISSHPDDPPMGLRDFVVPMRSSRIPYDEVKEIVLLGNAEYLHREWPQLRNLPLVTVVDGDPLNRADLRAVSIKTASVCVVLSAWTGKSVDPVLDDKTAVLTTLNVRAMPFDHPEGMDAHFELPIVTALQHNRNVRLLSEDASSEVEVRESFMMEPFMCGQTVTISALYSLISTSYFTPLAVPVVEHLLYGFQSPVMESYLAEGVGLMGGDEYNPDELSPYNIRVRLITVRDGPWTQSHTLNTSTTNLSYGELFVHALHSSMVCLGISRMFQPENATTAPKRIIISNPPRQTVLRWDDQVYVLTK